MGGYYDRLICLIVGLFWTGAGVLGFTTEWGGLQLFLISEEIAIEKLHGVGPVWIHWMKMIALPVAIIGLGNLVGAWLDSGSVLRLHSLVAGLLMAIGKLFITFTSPNPWVQPQPDVKSATVYGVFIVLLASALCYNVETMLKEVKESEKKTTNELV